MTNQQKIEECLRAFFKSRKISIRPDGLGDHHIVVGTNCPSLPGPQVSYGMLPTRCPLMVQCGEECGFDMERLNISEIAKAIIDA